MSDFDRKLASFRETRRSSLLGTLISVLFANIFGYIIVCAPLGAWLWPYTINTWLVVADKDPTVLWWQGAIIGIIPGLGQIMIPGALLTWIIMLFIG